MGDGGGGVGGSGGGGEDSFSLVFENSIVLIKCTLYDTVFQRQVSICRGVVFSYSFSIYCAAYHGIWCSVGYFLHLLILKCAITNLLHVQFQRILSLVRLHIAKDMCSM